MYEENLQPLPAGDATQVFAKILDEIRQKYAQTPLERITPESVVRWAEPGIQADVARICRRLLLPRSGIEGIDNLSHLVELSGQGNSCILCLNHRSNLDVPTLFALLKDLDRLDLFDRIIWVAGRKLHEDPGLTPLLIQGFHRVYVTPKSWMHGEHSRAELHEAHQINLAAHRAMHELRHQGWIFGLFPSGTRMRTQQARTARAIEEVDSYLKNFQYLLPARIDGCTLPVTRDCDMTHETPRLDRIRYTFGAVQPTDEWRARAAGRYASLDQRSATAQAIMKDIQEAWAGDQAAGVQGK